MAQAVASLGEEIGNAQIVVSPGGAQAVPPQKIGQRVDGRVHPVGSGLILNVNPIGADRARAGGNVGQEPPAPAAGLRQDTHGIRLRGGRDLSVGQDSDLRALGVQCPRQLRREPADTAQHRRIFAGDEQHFRLL